jgi:hypothetical protein
MGRRFPPCFGREPGRGLASRSRRYTLPGWEVSTGDGSAVAVEVLLNSKGNEVVLSTEEGSVPLLVVVLLESKLGNWVNVVLLLPEEGSAPLLKRLSPVPVDEGSVPGLANSSGLWGSPLPGGVS